ncbi:helix-turn-helix domain-containing protein [Streptomyces sp. S1D4-11]
MQGGGLTAERRAFRERIRMQAAELFAQGYDCAAVARELRVSVRSVQRWRQMGERTGELKHRRACPAPPWSGPDACRGPCVDPPRRRWDGPGSSAPDARDPVCGAHLADLRHLSHTGRDGPLEWSAATTAPLRGAGPGDRLGIRV